MRFMNIPERENENCMDIVYDIIENDLYSNPEDIRCHAVHRVGKPPTRVDSTTRRLRPIIARFVIREDNEAVFSVKNKLKSSGRYRDAKVINRVETSVLQFESTIR